MLFLPTEEAEAELIRVIDQSGIEDWHHFEYLLAFVLENRFIRVYQAYRNHHQMLELKEKKAQ